MSGITPSMISKMMDMPPVLPVRLYLVSYDLKEKTGDYAGLEEALRAASAVSILESAWILKSIDATAAAVEDRLRPFLHLNDAEPLSDKLFVCEVGSNRSGWLRKLDWEWINTL